MSLDELYPTVPTYPSPINETSHSRNGQRIGGSMFRRIQQGHNSVLAYRKKVFFSYGCDLSSIPTGLTGTTNRWRGMFRTGYNVSEIVFHIGLAPVTDGSSTDPYCVIDITPTGGSTFTTQELHYSRNDSSPSDAPDNYHWGQIVYRTSDSTPLAENTEYDFVLKTVDYARPFCMTAFEVGKRVIDTSDTASAHARTGVGSPIIDEDFQNMMVGQTAAWQKNGGHLFTWVSADGSGALVIPGASATNIWDDSTGGLATTVPSMRANLDYHRTVSATTVPVKFAVRAKRRAGAGTTSNNKVTLNGLGAGDIEISGVNDTEAWFTTTGSWSLGATNWHVTAESDPAGPDELRIYAVSVWEVE